VESVEPSLLNNSVSIDFNALAFFDSVRSAPFGILMNFRVIHNKNSPEGLIAHFSSTFGTFYPQ